VLLAADIKVDPSRTITLVGITRHGRGCRGYYR
jgi:hypothetical protein